MPLEEGCDKKAIQRNIKRLIDVGREPDQAVAIAYSVCERSKKKESK